MDVETILCTPVKGAGGGAPSDDVVLATPGSGTPGRWHGGGGLFACDALGAASTPELLRGRQSLGVGGTSLLARGGGSALLHFGSGADAEGGEGCEGGEEPSASAAAGAGGGGYGGGGGGGDALDAAGPPAADGGAAPKKRRSAAPQERNNFRRFKGNNARGKFSFKFQSKAGATGATQRFSRKLPNGRTIYARRKAPTMAGQVRAREAPAAAN
ncbi:hypothetical protein MNEG_12119 [Monoraphidium neglectum]|uniref:Uncharacterized protein n=1 Tax=Monoraphidium neglectum TaxID=145388 RepID=A0A0D2J7S2_9CHLO|nr:hypothetical protein MNEG_12119 [Monoraphidium neglectum]KIY95842.1 hypothetical protein MNEG_12119 [Monoraphidium neglectum]|eukprot:XP_013894862.1 hypothetical protein MNEG_12119 [Monoraphidium neglectum]